MDKLHAAFDAAMYRLLPAAELRPEQDADRDFLLHLFAACSPLAGILPAAMLTQQAELANNGFRSVSPAAMFRIASIDHEPAGRFAVDWNRNGVSHGIDLAVLPECRRSGLGLAMLRAWLAVADDHGLPCALEVVASNPARRIYQRLGFTPVPGMDETYAVIEMARPAVSRLN